MLERIGTQICSKEDFRWFSSVQNLPVWVNETTLICGSTAQIGLPKSCPIYDFLTPLNSLLDIRMSFLSLLRECVSQHQAGWWERNRGLGLSLQAFTNVARGGTATLFCPWDLASTFLTCVFLNFVAWTFFACHFRYYVFGCRLIKEAGVSSDGDHSCHECVKPILGICIHIGARFRFINRRRLSSKTCFSQVTLGRRYIVGPLMGCQVDQVQLNRKSLALKKPLTHRTIFHVSEPVSDAAALELPLCIHERTGRLLLLLWAALISAERSLVSLMYVTFHVWMSLSLSCISPDTLSKCDLMLARSESKMKVLDLKVLPDSAVLDTRFPSFCLSIWVPQQREPRHHRLWVK